MILVGGRPGEVREFMDKAMDEGCKGDGSVRLAIPCFFFSQTDH